jgi:hypothetical protein
LNLVDKTWGCTQKWLSYFLSVRQHLAQQNDTGQDEYTSRHASDEIATQNRFFHQDKRRNHGHPQEIHHPSDKDQGHEKPATSRAVAPMPQAHPKGAPSAVTPIRHQKS